MAVDLSIIFDEKVREFTVRGENERFAADFTTAARNTIRKMEIVTNGEEVLEIVTGTATSIDALDVKHTYIVSSGITFYLMRFGQKPRDNRTLGEAKSEWMDDLGDYTFSVTSTKMLTDTNDVVGLGAIGRDEA